MSNKKLNPIQRFVRWLFGAPFQKLPPEFGDPVPSDLRLLEARAEEIQHHSLGKVPAPAFGHHKQTKPVQQDESLERE